MRKLRAEARGKSGFARTGAILLFLLFSPSLAGASSIDFEYRLGFNGLFTLNRWNPVAVTIENRGRAIVGHLEIIATSGSDYRRDVYTRTYSTPVELPTNSKKQYRLTIFIESFAYPLVIRLQEGNETLASRSINLRSHYRTQKLLVIIDSRLQFQFDPGQADPVSPTSSRGRFLPEIWYGYDGVRMLVMPARAWQDIDGRQLTALEEWVSRGGCLVAAGGINYGPLTDRRLKKLLPLTISGIREVRGPGSLGSFTGVKISGREPALLLEAELEGGRVKVKEQDVPVIWQRPFGRGTVFFLAFDFEAGPFREWQGRQKFWTDLLSAIKERPTSFFDPPDQKIFNLMIENSAWGFPAFPWAVLILTLYIAPALLIIKKIETRKEKRWTYLGVMMLWVLMASSVFYGVLFTRYSRHGLTCNQLTMIRLSGSEPVPRFREFIGIYNLNGRSTRVHLGDEPYPVKGFMFERSREKIEHFFTLEERIGYQAIHLDSGRWSHRFFTLEGRLPFPVKARAVEDEKGLVVKIENRSPYQIDLCRLYYKERFFDIDPIPAQKGVTRRIDNETVPEKRPFPLEDKEFADNAGRTKTSQILFGRLPGALEKDLSLSIHSRYSAEKDMVHFSGWIDGAAKPITLEPSGPQKEAVTLVDWEIPVKK